MPRRSKSGSRNGSNLPTNVPEVSGRSGEVRQLGVVAEVELLQSGARPDLVRQPAQVVRRQRDLLNRCEKGTHTYIHTYTAVKGQGRRGEERRGDRSAHCRLPISGGMEVILFLYRCSSRRFDSDSTISGGRCSILFDPAQSIIQWSGQVRSGGDRVRVLSIK